MIDEGAKGQFGMSTPSPETRVPRVRGWMSLTPGRTILLAILFGLCGGYLDVLITVLGKYCWSREGYFGNARDFPWTVPAGHAMLLLIPGLLIAMLNACPSGRVSPRAGVWLLASLALWGALSERL